MGNQGKRSPSWAPSAARRGRGFTLVELLVVMAIIGIILTFILIASMDAARRAEERATQTLIAKLEQGVNDRLDALLQTQPTPTPEHEALAGVYNAMTPLGAPSTQRAQVIAMFDYIKRELPDVFIVQDATGASGYPLNFAANPSWSNVAGSLTYFLPIGTAVGGEGIYGASYTAAGAIYKNLGYLAEGYDGADNDNNGFIDDFAEGTGAWKGSVPTVPDPDNPTGAPIPLNQLISNRLGRHSHKTARSEMLYAILVEGQGPLGSIFTRDEFSDREVKDTDGDGLPEFVDAWGEPLQFYRWPLLYHSDVQKGQITAIATEAADTSTVQFLPPYQSVFEQREQDPLDPNQQLVAPVWWSAANNNGPAWVGNLPALPTVAPASPAVAAFESLFHRLREPMVNPGATATTALYWDRGSSASTALLQRRAFFSKFLIASSGLDGEMGIFRFPDFTPGTGPTPTAFLVIENNAPRFNAVNFIGLNGGGYIPVGTTSNEDLIMFGQDDITNHNLQGAGGTLQ